jgi:hypothetical protein
VKLSHSRLADYRAQYFFFTAFLKISLDPVGDGFDRIDADRPLLTGSFKPIDYFDPFVSLPSTIFLNHQRHHLFDPLISGKSPRTPGALAPAPDHIAILAQA